MFQASRRGSAGMQRLHNDGEEGQYNAHHSPWQHGDGGGHDDEEDGEDASLSRSSALADAAAALSPPHPPLPLPPPPPPASATKSNFISSMSNLSVQYNLSSASVAVAIMSESGVYPEPAWSSFLLLAMVFVGALLGMCIMGYLGDLIGRKRALIVTLSFTVVGSAGCALLVWSHNANAVYGILSLMRLILGIGVGGIYPLSAVTSSEGASEGEHVGSRVGWAFFWQTPGAMLPYLLALILLQYHGTQAVDMQFRLLMGLGALPSALVLWKAFQHEDSAQFRQAQSRTPLRDAWEKRHRYGRLLVGTAGTWFIYDVAFYGINIFTPDIIRSIFGEQSIEDLCWHSLVAQAIGIPGCILAITMLKTRGLYWLNFYGFLLLAALFAALALVYEMAEPQGLPFLKFFLYCLLMFALNFGPNVATYVQPAVYFPPQVRSIFHGLSAASAKLGAVMGTFIFKPVETAAGVAAVLWLQVVLCLVGVGITFRFIPRDDPRHGGVGGVGLGGGASSGGRNHRLRGAHLDALSTSSSSPTTNSSPSSSSPPRRSSESPPYLHVPARGHVAVLQGIRTAEDSESRTALLSDHALSGGDAIGMHHLGSDRRGQVGSSDLHAPGGHARFATTPL